MAERTRHKGSVPVRTADGIVHWEHPRYWYAICDASLSNPYMWQDGSEDQPLDTPVTCLFCLRALTQTLWSLP